MKTRFDADERDLEQLRDTCESPGYRLILDRLEKMRKDASRGLEIAAHWDEVLRYQSILGAIAAVLDAPKHIAIEIKHRSKKRNTDL